MDWEPRVGMKVTCVDNARYPALELGRVYTISGFELGAGIAPLLDTISPCGLHLVEAKPLDGFAWFSALRFKPLRERKTDIAIFRAMLVNPPKELVPASYEMPGRPFE